ncbi:modification methylase MboII [Caedimonas varicaedens]|uniref:site-specific DNA-methyltransferase (adenine-specific) n=1 Tax=Caedimonas varicaedens TaxID=1629334 RepID=A0A0K8MBD6_9PROT|nr:modification methylase MboII [Caedimonas varicaedens]
MPLLSWLNRNQHTKITEDVPYRLLEADDLHSAGDQRTSNMLIQGDNLHALKSLLPYYAGRVKCIFIDPPYNTKSAFEHYDDNLEHSQWLGMMFPRIKLLRELLSEDGSIWVTIDDHEAHYLKVIMDEIFGRKNFVANVVWQKRTSPDFRIVLGDAHDNILVFAKNSSLFKNSAHLLPIYEKQLKEYKNPDNDPRGAWVSRDFSAQGYRPNQMYAIVTPGGKKYTPPEGRCWKNVEDVYLAQRSDGRFWFGKDDKGVPRRKNYLSETEGRQSWTWWSNDEAGHNQQAKQEILSLFKNIEIFSTPKPERLIHRIFQIATKEGDLVLDSFLGSGTTAAVAHKMGRNYIGIEMGDHAITHCVPRLRKVISGEQGGISESVGWQGGGGYRFYRLGAPIFDSEGRINSAIKFPHLAAHIWFSETHTALTDEASSPFLGIYKDIAYYLLYNGILRDKRPHGGNVLTWKILQSLPVYEGQKVIYGEASRLSVERLKPLGIIFKQTPYDVKAS